MVEDGLFFLLLVLLWCFVLHVGLEFKKNLEVTEVRVLWQVKKWFLRVFGAESFSSLLFVESLVVFLVVVDFEIALLDKVHLLDVCLVVNNWHIVQVEPTKHGDDQVISESSLAFVKEMTKRPLKISKSLSALDQFSLHFWSDLLVELELFDYQVKVIHKGIFNVLSNVIIQVRLDMHFAVRLLQFLDPDVE